LRILSRIAEEIAASAPALVTLLTGFNRLTTGEDMPKRRPLGRLRKRVSTAMATRIFMGVWTFMTLAMIATALILSHLGPAAGPGSSGHVVTTQSR
jgi:hypothetical protein